MKCVDVPLFSQEGDAYYMPIWMKPELTVLLRSKAEEYVLE